MPWNTLLVYVPLLRRWGCEKSAACFVLNTGVLRGCRVNEWTNLRLSGAH